MQKFDFVVFTVGTFEQRLRFEAAQDLLSWKTFKRAIVIEDEFAQTGSAQPTINAIRAAQYHARQSIHLPDRKDANVPKYGKLLLPPSNADEEFVSLNVDKEKLQNSPESYDKNLKILIVHCGGYSKRLPHVAPFGKLFLRLDNHCILFNEKLAAYCKLISKLPPGVIVTCADTLETMRLPDIVGSYPEIILFAYQLSPQQATNHGVYVVDGDGDPLADAKTFYPVKTILQKPTIEEMKNAGAILPNGKVFTDCVYYISSNVASKLSSLNIDTTGIQGELCCYGDFIRPLANDGDDSYIKNAKDPVLKKNRKILFDFFHTFSEQTAVQVHRENSFMHLGTTQDYLKYMNLGSNLPFKITLHRVIHSSIPEHCFIDPSSVVEFCKWSSNAVKIGKNCLVSGIQADMDFEIPDQTLLIAWKLKDTNYVTIMMPVNQDVKQMGPNLTWYGFNVTGESFYQTPIFPIESTPMKSLKATFETRKNGFTTNYKYVSLATAIETADIQATLIQRQTFHP